MVSEKQVQFFLVIIVVFVIIGLLIGRFLTPIADWIDRFRKTEIKSDFDNDKITDPDLKKVYDTVLMLCKEGAERYEYAKMEKEQFRDPSEIANIIARAVKDCNGEKPSLPSGPNSNLKYNNKCQAGLLDILGKIEYNCGNDNKCTSGADRTLVINYDSDPATDYVSFCDSEAT